VDFNNSQTVDAQPGWVAQISSGPTELIAQAVGGPGVDNDVSSLNAHRWFAAVLHKLSSCPDQEAFNVIADGLRVLCGSHLSVLVVAASSSRFNMSGISPPSAIDRQSELVRKIERVAGDAVCQARTDHKLYDLAPLDLKASDVDGLKMMLQSSHLQFILLRDEAGIPAVCLLAGEKGLPVHVRQLLPLVCQTMAGQLRLRRRAQPMPIVRWLRTIAAPAAKHRLLTAILILAVGSSLLMPVRLRVSCDCVAQPKIRRFVSIPYEGRLEDVLVEPGDVVKKNQTIARMDAKEIRLELSSIEAEFHRTQKHRDMAMANRDTSTAQIANLELDRLNLRKQQLVERARNLDIESPIAGVVISGDPKKLEGARFSMGQTLVEIGQLQTMGFDLSIPDDEIAHVRPASPVRIKLGALPGTTLNGRLVRIHPRAELRDSRNVFIGNVELDQDSISRMELRPGMNGKAKIVGPRYPLAWILFHNAWEEIVYRFGW
jgi:biotin carboxyl carrier protein